MDLLAVRTARLIARLNVEELNPDGRPMAHDYLKEFVARYSFIKWPTTADEILDVQNKGITFENGKLGNVGITKVVLFDWGVAIETSASTEACEEILQDMLNWGAKTFGLANRPDLVTQRNYVSEIIFSSKLSLAAINPQINAVGQKIITQLVSQHIGSSQPFEITGIILGIDTTKTKQVNTPFQVHRLLDTPFSQNKYYSAAPIKTPEHIKIINDFEAMLPPPHVGALSLED